jgi:nitronate monooxygenase|uniref:Nitronate monooxygenase domain-containing protein n=2 Tax=Micromonas pusilla TaxID=38833 RepID=A0A7R9XVB1_MICPS|tara:strand:+ start:158 stop:1153 length:996 start_codon:yes stop_codon:yes gene_type:complete|mmetsp:Transcript_12183/g.43851  ORF Transcript_12183/g.43851 Transcript_12183/m.43851 type:complete len:332 (+) Transcript_12183:133-1128(+)
MVLDTRVTRLLGIEHPIIQGGMHYVGYAVLAAAVSNAGGLGTVTALTQKSPEDLRAEIRRVRALTSKPFAVNLTLLPSLAPPDYGAYARVIVEEKVPVVETAGRNPAEWITFFKKHGILVIHKCVAIKHALTAERLGADCISMDGFECAGHPGEDDVGNYVLLAKAAKKLTIPFVASGGVGTGSQLAAALALGAEGVNCGTRFMATTEAPIHDGIKRALVKGDERSTTLVMQSVGNTERVFKNRVTTEVREIEKRNPGKIEAIRHLVSGENYRKSFQESGDPDSSVWSAGIVMGLIDDVPSCDALVKRMVAEAEEIITGRLAGLVRGRSRL